MAVPESSLEDSPRSKMNKKGDKGAQGDKRLVVAAQEIRYAKYLAGNEKKSRDRALRSLKKWFQQRSLTLPFTEADLMVIWKGLFYSMWMSDKPLIQEECAENISLLIHAVTPDCRMMYFKCGLRTLANEWFGIDQLRLDKFMMLVRRVLRQAFCALKHENWKATIVEQFQEVLEQTVLNPAERAPLGLVMHFTEIYMEELSKVSEGKLHPTLLLKFLVPFAKQLVCSKEARQVTCIRKNIFRHLMRQSDVGMDYNEKYQAWRKMGFPGKSIDSLQKEVLSDDEKMSDDDDTQLDPNVLDPRAGHVDVVLPQLKFNPKHIVALLTKNKFLPGSNTKSRRALTQIIHEFTELSQGRFPLGVKKLEIRGDDGPSTNIKQSVNRLVKFEQKLMGLTKKRKTRDALDKELPLPKKPKIEGKRKLYSQESTSEEEEDCYEEVVKKPKLKLKTTFIDSALDESAVQNILNVLECSFKSNSGKWHVYNANNESTDDSSDMEATPKPQTPVPPKKDKSNLNKRKKTTPKRILNGIPASKATLNPVRASTPQKLVFETAEWDAPLQDGEVEFFVPSNKYKAKMKQLTQQSNRNITDLITSSMQRIKGKNRHSIGVDRPHSLRNGSSPGEKKVKIDLRLNKSQEIHEHISTLRRSPAIPFDANRKPSKPLLKPHLMASPINPFYKRKLKL